MKLRVSAALLAVTVLSYGLWIRWWGLFGNDIPYLWYYHLFGAWGPGRFAAIDRPASALFYAAVTAVLGETVWSYHILLLLLRWGAGVLLWWLLGLVWPQQRGAGALAALLLVVYPGFGQMPVSVEFILHFAVLDLTLASIGCSLLAVLQPRRAPWFALAAALLSASLFWLEYFIGLEVLRLALLLLVARQSGASARRLALTWLPVLAVLLAFLIWRVFAFQFPTYRPVLIDALRNQPLRALIGLGKTSVHDLWTAGLAAWGRVFGLPGSLRQLALWLLLAAGGALSAVLAYRSPQAERQPAGLGLLVVGWLAMLAGGMLFWLTGIDVSLDFPWDRATLALMPGASLALAGFIELAFVPRFRLAAAMLLVGLATAYHYQNALIYRAEWQKLQDFAWQLTWRAPALESGALLVFDAIPLNRYSDNDLTALLNWSYAPDLQDTHLPYRMLDLTLRMEGEWAVLPGLAPGLPVQHHQRGLMFESSTSQLLALHVAPPGCLVLLGPGDALLPGLPGRLPQAAEISNLALVSERGAAQPPAALGPEPQHGWCYYYQKASLANQMGRWAEVIRLGEEAAALGLRWNTPAELLPFLEAGARTNTWERARAWNQEIARQPELAPALCALWLRVAADGVNTTEVMKRQAEAGCLLS